MAVTILDRPEGYSLSATPIVITATDSTGDVLMTAASNPGRINGDIVYISSFVEDYNGFYELSDVAPTTFKLKYIGTSDYVEYVSDTTGNYFASTLTHGWSAVHLPITYKLSSDLYPTNSVDTAVNINSVQDANGYTVLQLSGSLGSVHTYDFIEITLPSDTELSGIYQIVEFISPTVVLINLLYDSTNNFTSATAQKVYNNYNIVVRVYSGLNASHQWASVKPYELITTLELTPDENNETFFSINEYLKKLIETRNNLVLGTLPNNLDFMTMFYIEVAESYDDSDGYVFGTYTSPFTSDQANFEGYAVNSKLVFKNIYSGYLSEYLMTNNTGKFLTLFTIPVLFACGTDTPDCYSDISFLNPNNNSVVVRKQFYLNGNLGTTVNDTLNGNSGVIRAELEADCNYDRVDVSILPALSDDFNDYLQTGSGAAWTGFQTGLITGPGATSIKLYIPISLNVGDTISFDYDIFITNTAYVNGNRLLNFRQLDSALGDLGSLLQVGMAVGSNIGTLSSMTIVSGTRYLEFWFSRSSVFGETGSFDALVNSLSISGETAISETKEFKIDCGCAQQEIRLTWLNNLGGFDYWAFTAKAEHIVEIREVMETKKNIFPAWPKSYGADADTIRKQTSRVSNKAYTVRSQYMTQDEADAVSYIKSSVLVQIVNSRTDRRTVIVDADSFVKYQDRDKTYSISFNISFTDDIPSQTV